MSTKIKTKLSNSQVSPKDKFFAAKSLRSLKKTGGHNWSKADLGYELQSLNDEIANNDNLSQQEQYFLSLAIEELENMDEGSVTTSGGSGGGSVTVIEQNRYSQKVVDSMPSGTIITHSGQSLPTGFFPCDGRRISRSEFEDLFKSIGEKWGAGDGTSTFDIPNLTHSNASLGYYIKIYEGGVNKAGSAIGEIKQIIHEVVPENFMMCDGRNLAIADYGELYKLIGRTYTAPEVAQDVFSIPDFRGQFLRGKTTIRNFQDYEENDTKSHTHSGSVDNHTHSTPNHTHPGAGNHSHSVSHTHPQSAHSHTVGDTGGATSHPDHDHDIWIAQNYGACASGPYAVAVQVAGKSSLVALKDHVHGAPSVSGGSTTTGDSSITDTGGANPGAGNGGAGTTGGTAPGLTINNTGGVETRPNNYPVNYIICVR